MREFILLARHAKTTPDFSLSDLPNAGRLDLVCRAVSNALFLSEGIRRDTIIHIAMNGPPDPPKIISFSGASLSKDIKPDEHSIAEYIKLALQKGKSLKLNETIDVCEGISISKKSFEALIREKANEQLIYLHKKGKHLEDIELKEHTCLILGDNQGLPKNTEKLLDRLGAERASIGPLTLFASHCIVIVHNALDRTTTT